MSELRKILFEEIGFLTVEVATTGECAPHCALIDAVDAYDNHVDNLIKAEARITELEAQLGDLTRAASLYLLFYEGVYDMTTPEPFQSNEAEEAEINIRSIINRGKSHEV